MVVGDAAPPEAKWMSGSWDKSLPPLAVVSHACTAGPCSGASGGASADCPLDAQARPATSASVVTRDVTASPGSVSGCDVASDDARDRKSTRLNSSHSQISYAVFCLKKKKKK